jgi:hypothetical protein
MLARQKTTVQEPLNVPFGGLAKALITFSKIVDFMRRWESLGRFNTSIDLGGGMGGWSAFFRGAGIVGHTTNVDLADYSGITRDGYFQAFLSLVANLTDDVIGQTTQLGLKRAKRAFDLPPDIPVLANVHADFPEFPKVDAFQHRDLFEAEGIYDLVSSCCTLDLYDLDHTFAKIRSLLGDNGVYVGLEEYWWWIANSSGIQSLLPYAMQRLTREEFRQYVSQHRPKFQSSFDALYDYLYAGKRPLVDDWRAAAQRQGLALIAVERIVPKRHHRAPICPPALFRKGLISADEILRDIHRHTPRAGIEDLMTSSIMLLAKKV